MLAGVLLHVVKAALPVDLAGDHRADLHFFLTGVENDAAFFVHVRDGHAVQRAVVGGLSAALGVKGGAVQCDEIPVLARLAGEHRGGELPQEGIFIVELFRFHGGTFLSVLITKAPGSASR